jgi:DUF971 family protein
MTIASENIRVKNIGQTDERTLAIQWTDGRTDALDVVALRRRCPCAQCVDEWTRERTLKPEAVAETVRPVRIDSVGSYALKIQFNDGHATGIYTFQMLRDLVAPRA